MQDQTTYTPHIATPTMPHSPYNTLKVPHKYLNML